MFKILGADGREYGPVSFDQVKQWVAEGRINSRTLIQAPESANWQAAAEIPEINPLFSPSASPPCGPGAVVPPAIGPAPAKPAQQKGLAIASFVLGVVSFALCTGILTGIPAIICGHVAKNRTRQAPEQYGGAGFASAGLILGYLSVIYTILIIAMLLPVFSSTGQGRQITACNSHMKQIGLALRMWALDHKGAFPFNVSTNAGGTKELCEPGSDGFDKNAAIHLAAIGKELGSTAALLCPADTSKRPARDFAGLTTENISYLLRTGPEVTDTNSAEILLKCPLHGTLLRCDGSVEIKLNNRRMRL
jgi:Domain of unknown function (DUF4190)/GYF domain 2